MFHQSHLLHTSEMEVVMATFMNVARDEAKFPQTIAIQMFRAHNLVCCVVSNLTDEGIDEN